MRHIGGDRSFVMQPVHQQESQWIMPVNGAGSRAAQLYVRREPCRRETGIQLNQRRPNAPYPSRIKTDIIRRRFERMQKPLKLPALSGTLQTLIRRKAQRDQAQILCVEDDEDSLKQAAAALSPWGEITCARTLAEARAALLARRFDLLVLDLGLPDGDGRSLLPLLPKEAPPPVLVFSEKALSPDATLQFAAVLGKAGTTQAKLAEVGRLLLSHPSTAVKTSGSTA